MPHGKNVPPSIGPKWPNSIRRGGGGRMAGWLLSQVHLWNWECSDVSLVGCNSNFLVEVKVSRRTSSLKSDLVLFVGMGCLLILAHCGTFWYMNHLPTSRNLKSHATTITIRSRAISAWYNFSSVLLLLLNPLPQSCLENPSKKACAATTPVISNGMT